MAFWFGCLCIQNMCVGSKITTVSELQNCVQLIRTDPEEVKVIRDAVNEQLPAAGRWCLLVSVLTAVWLYCAAYQATNANNPSWQ